MFFKKKPKKDPNFEKNNYLQERTNLMQDPLPNIKSEIKIAKTKLPIKIFKEYVNFIIEINSRKFDSLNQKFKTYSEFLKAKKELIRNALKQNNDQILYYLEKLKTNQNTDISKIFLVDVISNLIVKGKKINSPENISKINLLISNFNGKDNLSIKKMIKYYKYLILLNKFEKISEKEILREFKRIESGLILTKIFSKKHQNNCEHTYSGFLTAIKENTVYFVKIKNKTYLAKSSVSFKEHNAQNKLLLDPVSLNVYSFKNKPHGIEIVIQENYKTNNTLIKNEIKNMLERFRENYIAHYESKIFKTEEQRQKVLQRIRNIFSQEKINSFIQK